MSLFLLLWSSGYPSVLWCIWHHRVTRWWYRWIGGSTESTLMNSASLWHWDGRKHLQDYQFVGGASSLSFSLTGSAEHRWLNTERPESWSGRGRDQAGQVSADWPVCLSILVWFVLYLVSVSWVTAGRWARGRRISGKEKY